MTPAHESIRAKIIERMKQLDWTPTRLAREARIGEDISLRFVNGTHDTTTRNADRMLAAMKGKRKR